MKSTHPKKKTVPSKRGKPLTFGDLVLATYRAYGDRRAGKMLKFAINSQLIRFERLSGNVAAC